MEQKVLTERWMLPQIRIISGPLKKFIILLILLLSGNIVIKAQVKTRIDYYGTEDGLSHHIITTIIKDKDGFMWMGSWNGINRFDGEKFVSYKPSADDKYQLENNRIDQLVDDKIGSLWFKAYDKHIYRFDKKSRKFYPLYALLKNSSMHNIHFQNLFNSRDGLIWLLSENKGIFCINPKSALTKEYLHFSEKSKKPYRLTSNKINFFFEDKENNIWLGSEKGLNCLIAHRNLQYTSINPDAKLNKNVLMAAEDGKNVYFGTADGMLLLFDKQKRNLSYIRLCHSSINSLIRSKVSNLLYITTVNGELISINTLNHVIQKRGPGLGELWRIYEDHSGVLWIEPRKYGAVKFDPSTGKFSIIRMEHSSFNQSNKTSFFKVLEDINGNIWINTKDNGFGYYDKEANIIRHIPYGDRGNSFPGFVEFAYYDTSGVFWVKSDRGGIIKVALQRNNFNRKLLKLPQDLESENDVRAVFADRNNRIWFATKSSDIYIVDNYKKLHPVFLNISSKMMGPIYTICEDSKGRIWMGSKTNGIFVATPVGKDKLTYKVVHYGKSSVSDGLTSNQIYSIVQDKYGNMWLGSFDGGLMKIMETPEGFKDRFFFHNYPKTGFNKIRDLHFDFKGNLWIGTTGGLIIMDGQSDTADPQFISYRKLSTQQGSLGNNDIQDIYEDSEKRIWLATSGGGLAQAIGRSIKNLKFRNYTVQDGLPNDFIYSIVEDNIGNLWVATENGLSKFNYSTGAFINYNFYDGLPGTPFSEGVGAKDMRGNIYFGLTKGYLQFNPQNLNNNRIKGSLVFTNLQINNKNEILGMNDNLNGQDINYLHKLVLKYNQNVLRLDCALLDYRFKGKELIAYRLKGFDSSWYKADQNTQITYTNLPAGKYQLEIKALRKDLYTNNVYRTLSIIVKPAPWKTWWAYTLYAIASITLIVILSRSLFTMLKLRHNIELEKKLAALKLNFFTNVSHELRTPLTLILGPLEQLSQKENFSSEGRDYLQVIKKNATRMAHYINQLLELRKLQAGSAKLNILYIDIIELVKNCGQHFLAAAKNKGIHFHINNTSEKLFAFVDAEKIDTVIYNLLSNAFKFTPDGKPIEVLIELFPDSGTFQVSVSDEGPGVPEEDLPKIFELFNRGNELNNHSNGTGIGLALCRELVALHKGNIAATNRKTGGLAISFIIDCNINKQTEQSVPQKSFVLHEKLAMENDALNPDIPTHVTSNMSLVLLVEDNVDLNSFIKKQLQAFYKVETAFDGEEGLQKALALKPEIIISDIMMPKMDGITMLDKLKNNLETSHIPVVLLSAKSSIESRIEGLNYGADFYITKPFSTDFLMASVKNLIRQRAALFQKMLNGKISELKPGKILMTSKDEDFLKRVVQIINDNMDDSAFNIEATAAQLNMAHNTFYKKFKSLTNLTPVEFVRDIKLQRAKEYLETGEYNVSEVAYMTGFNNPKYFSTCFKDKYHMSPSTVSRFKTKQL
ncbi:hybrid sensor histidine kinase/response regulator transcription factor [Arachidicoccus soli]|uniref:histidine kinase n=1 Tax=Arachidicoccus soli TaxID=2341117 RepID=A0A386HNC3_9BACT|nr:two-component regulator propeller domain-containing protein [Arachidicoccus soli]AYD47305.1 hybrid sensor histidine kinase/response regulator [Arachidicoccus soli]